MSTATPGISATASAMRFGLSVLPMTIPRRRPTGTPCALAADRGGADIDAVLVGRFKLLLLEIDQGRPGHHECDFWASFAAFSTSNSSTPRGIKVCVFLTGRGETSRRVTLTFPILKAISSDGVAMVRETFFSATGDGNSS